MGNDGGVIAVKRRFMRHGNPKSKKEKLDLNEIKRKKVTTCSLTDEPLKEPIVVCLLGNLYNKTAVIEHLLSHTIPPYLQHITSISDVITCKFTNKNNNLLPSNDNNNDFKYICPITMIELNGNHPFYVSKSCGCVFSEKALKQMNHSINNDICIVCSKELKNNKTIINNNNNNNNILSNLIQLFPTDEEKKTELRIKIMEQKEKEKKFKKEKKKLNKRSRNTNINNHENINDNNEQNNIKNKKIKIKKNKIKSDTYNKHNDIINEANKIIVKGKTTSKVFSSLFTKEEDKVKNPNELLMSIAGIRYTLA